MSTQLQPHQQQVVDKLFANNAPHGVIAYHSMGSGKTFTALKAAEKALELGLGSRVLFIVPASLVDNIYKEVQKHGLTSLLPKIDVVSYEKASRDYENYMMHTYALVVCDEAHRLRNTDTDRVRNVQHILNSAQKVLLLTGTAGYNHPADIAGLINRIEPKEKLPDDHTAFAENFIDGTQWQLRNVAKLKPILNKYVSRYETPQNSKDFPTVTRKIINVPMSEKQEQLYRILERSIPSEMRSKLRKNLPMTIKDAASLNLFSQGVRQASDSITHHDVTTTYHDSPKIMAAVNSMLERAKEPGFRGVLYSNYLDAGINPYKKALEDNGLSPLVFTGSLSPKAKKVLVNEYNSTSKDPKILLLSSSGGEGLDLKNTRLLQLLEPHFNEARLRQAEARAVRYKSHSDLPRNKQHVDIEEYRSQLPKTLWQQLLFQDPDTGIDDYLARLASKKQGIIDQMDRLTGINGMKKQASDNYLRNFLRWREDSREKTANIIGAAIKTIGGAINGGKAVLGAGASVAPKGLSALMWYNNATDYEVNKEKYMDNAYKPTRSQALTRSFKGVRG